MAERYDLRSQQDVDRSSYVALPGTTTGGEFVTHNITPMKSKLSPAREVPGADYSKLYGTCLADISIRLQPGAMDLRTSQQLFHGMRHLR